MRGLERTIADLAKIWQHTVRTRAARCSERGLAGVVPGEEEQVLELRRPKVEGREAIVALHGVCMSVSIDSILANEDSLR